MATVNAETSKEVRPNFLFITNFKTYKEGSADGSVALVEQHLEAAKQFPDVQIFCAVQALDLLYIRTNLGDAISRVSNFGLLAQHIDPVGYGSFTGQINPERLVQLGAKGTLLNHSERRLERYELLKSIELAKGLGLKTIVCCESAEEGRSLLELQPDYLALEPPELIGGDISVSKAEADLIDRTLKAVGPGCNLLVGAGVKDRDDISIAVEMGACGVLVASGVVKAADPKLALLDMLKGF